MENDKRKKYDVSTFLDNTPIDFYLYYFLGSAIILVISFYFLFSRDPNRLFILAVGALGLAAMAGLAIALIRKYSRIDKQETK